MCDFMRKRQLIIKKNVSQTGTWLFIEYVRYFEDYLQLCKGIIDGLLENEEITISQFYDERQRMLSNSMGLYQQVRDLFGYMAISTKEMNSTEFSSENDQKYVIHFKGTYNNMAMNRLIRFGGDSLPFIIYANPKNSDNWFEDLIERNLLFVKWFYSTSVNNEVFTLLSKSDIVLFGSDDWLNVVIPNHSVEKVMKAVSNQCVQFGVDFSYLTTHS